jgi:prepilin-type N-terminal cleavage/methylation domain-containing protein
MKSTFTAKYLQHLNKKNGNKGFTLIELLVVIIIVGVLAAIALPSFLNQIGKARGSEAKSSLGTINRSQQAYRLENNVFANNVTNLDAKITGKFYTYSIPAASATTASAITTTTAAATDLKVSSSFVQQNGDTFTQIICESTNTVAGAATAPTNVTTCAANYVPIQ